jgi:hypothetical protein
MVQQCAARLFYSCCRQKILSSGGFFILNKQVDLR